MNSTKLPQNEPWGETVDVEFEEGIAWVYFNRPDKRNCMSPTLNREMFATLDALELDERCQVLVLTGKGESWSAGMDLKEYFREVDGAPEITKIRTRREAAAWQWHSLKDYPKPTIAMVNGWCFGGAFVPLVACDLAIAAEEATFGLSEINWGIPPGGNVPKALAETVSYRDALYYTMTGESFDGRRAAEIRLVNEAVPLEQLRERTRSLAQVLLGKDPEIMRAARETFKRVDDMDWETANDYIYAKLDSAIFKSGGGFRKGAMKAFLDDKTIRPGLDTYKPED
jgi:trans-feruloyl-CoA hydratase/vanillin synthase